MDVLECIRTRRSIRRFLSVPVPWDHVGSILEAGKAAPSAGNLQPWKFVVLDDPGLVKAIANACLHQSWIATAPVVIVITCDYESTKKHFGIRGERLYAIQDCAAAIENMLLAAHSLGLGACWVGAFEETMVRNVCAIPDNSRPQAIIPIGYPDETPPEPVELPLQRLTGHNGYGATIRKIDNVTKQYGDVWRDDIKHAKTDLSRVFKGTGQKIKRVFKKDRN